MSFRHPLPLLLAAASLLSANDGVDRYRKAVPNTFRLFPAPVSAASGYGILPRDMEGGADGDIRFRWAQPHAVDLVRVAARAVARDLGPAANPLLIMDLSAENGDTPADGRPARGRHPGGSHDGGLNLDLGYYLTSLKGKVYTPDFAAATEHFEQKTDGTWKDIPQCLGPADRLDVPRMARFFVECFRIDRDAFGGDLLEEIGVDFQVRQPVLEQVRTWSREGRFGADLALVDAMERVLTCDEAEGWARTHHHHLHLRLRDLPLLGRHRPALAALQARARAEEAELRGAPSLHASLLTSDLTRSIEVELLPQPRPLKSLRFRVDGGPWKSAQPGDARNRAVLDLPARAAAGQAVVEAEAVEADGKRVSLHTTLDLPAQEDRLAVAVEAARLTGDVVLEGAQVRIRPHFPQAYLAWVTETALVVHRKGHAPEKRVVAGPGNEVTLNREGLTRVDLRVLCSGRRPIQVPLMVE